MTVRSISRKELLIAQLALSIAILLQIAVWSLNREVTYGPHGLIIVSEIILAVILGVSVRKHSVRSHALFRTFSVALIGLISVENIISFLLVASLLITGNQDLSGRELLLAALAIFVTNIIVFALWYWEIDSPGFSGRKWSKHDKDFQFTQQDMKSDFSQWQPGFVDYLYLSLTNAINFAPADVKPITQQAKSLMGMQALLSVFTLALILARSISILR